MNKPGEPKEHPPDPHHPTAVDPTTRRWSPWAELARLHHVHVELVELPSATGGGVLARTGGQVVVLIDRRLSTPERTCVLAHELIHLERGTEDQCIRTGGPSVWTSLMVREETAVIREVARRLVPHGQLGRELQQLEVEAGGVDVDQVAERFRVTRSVAETAMRCRAAVRSAEGRAA